MAKQARKTQAKKPAMPKKITGKKAPAKIDFNEIKAKAGDKKIVLHIGCGQINPEKLHHNFRGEEWFELRLDINADVNPDIVADMLDMSIIPDEAVDAVWSSHNIEHLYPHQVPVALKEINRVTAKDGCFLVTMPDIQTVATYVAHGQLEEPLYDSPAGPISAIDIMYGLRTSLADGNLYMAHRTAYTAKSLGLHLKNAGFNTIRVSREWVNLWAVGYKYSKDHPQFRDDIQVMTDEKARQMAMPAALPLNRAPHPGAISGKLTDQLDVPPTHWDMAQG